MKKTILTFIFLAGGFFLGSAQSLEEVANSYIANYTELENIYNDSSVAQNQKYNKMEPAYTKMYDEAMWIYDYMDNNEVGTAAEEEEITNAVLGLYLKATEYMVNLSEASINEKIK